MHSEDQIVRKKKIPKYGGTTFINNEQCKGCGFCIEFCPTQVLAFSSDFNVKGYHFPVMVQESDCTGCDLCGLYCPDFAIFGIRYNNPEFQSSETNRGSNE